MATSPESSGPKMFPGKSSTKHNLLTDGRQSLRRALKAQEDFPPRVLSSCTPGRSVSPGIQNQAQDARLASRSPSGCQPGHHGYHTSAEYGQHQYHTGTSARDRTRISSYRSPFRQSTGAQSSGLASPPEPSEDFPVMPQASASCASHAPPYRQWAFVQPDPNQPLQGYFSPYAMLGHQSTNYVYANPPANVPLALLPRYISYIDEATVRNHLAIAVVRHKDIHDMVAGEYEKIVKETQDQWNEDASVLSFAKEHITVQKVLCEEYDDLPNSMRQQTVHRAVSTISQTIMAIPPHVRPGSHWRTKFNAFLTLVWIGKAIVHGTGLLPNAIRAQMAIDSQLVGAMEVVYAKMSEAELLGDGSRLYGALLELNKDREHYFKGLERIVEMFDKVMRQEMTM